MCTVHTHMCVYIYNINKYMYLSENYCMLGSAMQRDYLEHNHQHNHL